MNQKVTIQNNAFFKRIAFTILGFCLFQISYCQENYLPGYIIPLKGDTLHGFIDYRNWESNPKKIAFKESLSSDKANYAPLDIKAFGVFDELYESAIVEIDMSPVILDDLDHSSKLILKSDTVFLQTMINGPKSLYNYYQKFRKPLFYIKRESVFELLIYKTYLVGARSLAENKKYIGQLTYYLQDCPSIQSKLKNVEYDKKSLESLFLFYYNSMHSTITFQKKTEKLLVKIGMTAGITLTSLKLYDAIGYADILKTKYNQSLNFTGGVFFDLIVPRNNQKLSIYNELNITSYKVKGMINNNTYESGYTNTYTSFGYSYLKLLNMLRYKYPIGKLSVFANAGFSNGLICGGTNSQNLETKYYESYSNIEFKAIEEIRKYELGYILGMGCRIEKFSLEFRYEKGSGFTNYQDIRSNTTRYYFLIGCSF